ncbi:MAG: GNAT family N-acetyltransferase [Flavobacteriaceae bacterium]|nr:GNAT family N-acetyltransferase [Flavobacteriaceae bacterium]
MIQLEKFEKSDYDRLINWIDTEELLVIFSGQIFDFPITYEQLDSYLDATDRLVYKVVEQESNTVIGHAELTGIDYRRKSARICRILIGDTTHRNNGYGTLIMKELIRIGFSELSLHRLDLGVYDFNTQAIKCYQNCGFEIEGLLKDNMRYGDTYWSSYNMSILNN